MTIIDGPLYQAITQVTTTVPEKTDTTGQITIDENKLQERVENVVDVALDKNKYDGDITEEVQAASSKSTEPAPKPPNQGTTTPPTSSFDGNEIVEIQPDTKEPAEIKEIIPFTDILVEQLTGIDNKTEIISLKDSCVPLAISEQSYTTDCHPSFDVKDVAILPSEKIEDPVEESDVIDIVVHKTETECDCEKYTLEAPEINVCNDSDGNIVVEWEGIPCATVYEIYRDSSSVPVAIIPNPTLHYVDTVVDTDLHTYTVRAIRYNRDGTGIDSECDEEAATEESICVDAAVTAIGSITGLVDDRIYGILQTQVDYTGTLSNCVNTVFIRQEDSDYNGILKYYFSTYNDITGWTGEPEGIWYSHNIAFDIGYATYDGMVYKTGYNKALIEDSTMSFVNSDDYPVIALAENTETTCRLHFAQSSKKRPTSSTDWGFKYDIFTTSNDIYYIKARNLVSTAGFNFDNFAIVIALNNGKIYYIYSTDTGQTWLSYDMEVLLPVPNTTVTIRHFVFNKTTDAPEIILETDNDNKLYIYIGSVKNPTSTSDWSMYSIADEASLELYYNQALSQYDSDNCIEEAQCAPCYTLEVFTRDIDSIIKYEAVATTDV